MASCREILTLQFGSYANFVGTHWWNIQESGFQYQSDKISEVCHDVLFREGLTMRGEVTFTPRALFVDRTTKLPPVPILDEPIVDTPILWDDNCVERVDTSKPEKSLHPFIQDLEAGVDVSGKEYDFEMSVRGWSDLLRTRLHPRSVLMGYNKEQEEIEDRIRLYVEECDNIQGFHVLLDATDNFQDVLSYLEDEYSSKTFVTFPLGACSSEALNWRNICTRVVRTSMSYKDSAMFSTLTVPLSCVSEFSLKSEAPRAFPYLTYIPESRYHTSAILAAFLDTYTLGYRRQDNCTKIYDFISGLTVQNWKFSIGSLSLPFPKLPGASLRDTLEARDDDIALWSGISSNSLIEDSWYQNMTLRGMQDGQVLAEYLRYLSTSSSAVYSSLAPLPTLAPFPKIFKPEVSCKGSVDPNASRAPGFEVSSCPVLAGLHVCPGVGAMLQNISDISRNVDLNRLPELEIEGDLWEECIETLKTFAKSHSLTMDIN